MTPSAYDGIHRRRVNANNAQHTKYLLKTKALQTSLASSRPSEMTGYTLTVIICILSDFF
jgi:hypothetical protein